MTYQALVQAVIAPKWPKYLELNQSLNHHQSIVLRLSNNNSSLLMAKVLRLRGTELIN